MYKLKMSTRHVNVLILGGGIGGLSAAHELRQRNYNGSILLLERNPIIGGVARSSYHNKWPTEYSWRIYGADYKSVLKIMKEIPFNDNKTVYDNLIEIKDYLVVRKNGSFFQMGRPNTVIAKYIPTAFEGQSLNVVSLLGKNI